MVKLIMTKDLCYRIANSSILLESDRVKMIIPLRNEPTVTFNIDEIRSRLCIEIKTESDGMVSRFTWERRCITPADKKATIDDISKLAVVMLIKANCEGRINGENELKLNRSREI